MEWTRMKTRDIFAMKVTDENRERGGKTHPRRKRTREVPIKIPPVIFRRN